MNNADEIAGARVDALDRAHGTALLYRRVDDGAKSRVRLSFAAYDEAMCFGDRELAAAARDRFLRATAEIRGRR